jgi:hypothetical protein
VKYLVLIYSNPASRQAWENMAETDRAGGWEAYAALNAELEASGELIVTEALADPSQGRRLPVTEQLAGVTDGPFAEVKEHLAGFFLIECESMERALEVGAKVPEAAFGLVEVRPVMDLSGMDM